jgi:predicted phosphate transport protein (TIGR00153 family)
MKFSFIPRDEKFFDLFEEAAQNIFKASKLLKDMLDNYSQAETKAKEIFDTEYEGDRITHEIIRHLNKTFITPLDREDIYNLASKLDDILDLIEAATDRMIIYKIEEPTIEARKLAGIIHRMAEVITWGVSNLKHLGHVYDHCIEINRLENEADRVTRDAIGRLFEEEKDPIAVIKWKEIYETLEDTTDSCEDVANILESVVLKNA